MKYLIISLLFLSSCQNRNAVDNIEIIPKYSEADQPFADVFKILDGTWEGEFKIYEDSKRLPVEEIDLKNLTAASIQKEGIKLSNSILVQQIYISESPYFQKVSITDTYPESEIKSESGKQEKSVGVNKIQDGKMWCVVKKPSETVIHHGSTDGPGTIIWQSDSKEKKEYFYETVTKDYYEIIGWGYYGASEDRSLSPKLWFYSKYKKVAN